MPGTDRSITVAEATEHVRRRAVGAGRPGVGAEVEWIVVDSADRLVRPALADVARLATAAKRTRVTFEPGGQLELSSEPGALGNVCDAIAADEAAVSAALQSAGLSMIGIGLDPVRRDRRLVFAPRYDAMERYFDASGRHGRRMMCGTASIQVNVDAGVAARENERWRHAHAIGPMLVAAFANSPFAAGRPTGWRSTRMANWWLMDRTRTLPAIATGDVRADWAAYALRANVMMIGEYGGYTVPESRVSFADWIERGYAGLHPTIEDLDYHLTTLFPPVRARGWLELRFLDAQDGPWWRAAVAVTVALMDDPAAARRAAAACAPLAGRWMDAARDGLTTVAMRAAAAECFDAALSALPRLDADEFTIATVERFVEAFVSRGRCPADDLLDRSVSPALLLR